MDAFEDDDDVDSIIDKHLKGKELVVVQCALSQQRGPFAARRWALSIRLLKGCLHLSALVQLLADKIVCPLACGVRR